VCARWHGALSPPTQQNRAGPTTRMLAAAAGCALPLLCATTTALELTPALILAVVLVPRCTGGCHGSTRGIGLGLVCCESSASRTCRISIRGAHSMRHVCCWQVTSLRYYVHDLDLRCVLQRALRAHPSSRAQTPSKAAIGSSGTSCPATPVTTAACNQSALHLPPPPLPVPQSYPRWPPCASTHSSSTVGRTWRRWVLPLVLPPLSRTSGKPGFRLRW
jgi:hypothetical protein